MRYEVDVAGCRNGSPGQFGIDVFCCDVATPAEAVRMANERFAPHMKAFLVTEFKDGSDQPQKHFNCREDGSCEEIEE